eukprot:jgi/Psemu1/309486/fgenesh1_kg.516_\
MIRSDRVLLAWADAVQKETRRTTGGKEGTTMTMTRPRLFDTDIGEFLQERCRGIRVNPVIAATAI